MLHLFTGLYDEWTHVEPYRIVLVGPTGQGKSAVLASLGRAVSGHPGLPITSLRPTLGQNVVDLRLPLPLPPSLQTHVRAALAKPVARSDLNQGLPEAASSEGQEGKLGPGSWWPFSSSSPAAQNRRRPTPGKLTFWDLGASADLPTLWHRYYAEADCLIYVVDASAWSFLLPRLQSSDVNPGLDLKTPQASPNGSSDPAPSMESDANRIWTQLGQFLLATT